MLNVDVSAQHKLTLDDVSGAYSMQSSLGVEVINKSIERITITSVKIVSKKKSFLSTKIQNVFSENRNDTVNPESSFQFNIRKVPFEERRKYTLIINDQFISNEF